MHNKYTYMCRMTVYGISTHGSPRCNAHTNGPTEFASRSGISDSLHTSLKGAQELHGGPDNKFRTPASKIFLCCTSPSQHIFSQENGSAHVQVFFLLRNMQASIIIMIAIGQCATFFQEPACSVQYLSPSIPSIPGHHMQASKRSWPHLAIA